MCWLVRASKSKELQLTSATDRQASCCRKMSQKIMSWVRSGEEQKEENGNFIGILKSSYYILEWYLFSLCTYIVRATSTWFESESLERSSSCKGSMRHMNEIEKSFRRKWHNYIYRIGRMEIGKWKLFTGMLFGFWLLLPSVVDWDGV